MTTAPERYEEIRFTQRNGLKLYARLYPARHATPASATRRTRPLLCLAGLTRNSRDFHAIALELSQGERARNVYTLDSRGRGYSEYDPDWRNYTVPSEMQDAVDFMISRGIEGSAILGTSRGGLIAMVMAAAHPSFLGPVILNDIGPVIDREGLARIASYVGRTPLPHDWQEAATFVREMNAPSFPAVPHDEWETISRQLFNDRNGRPAPGYDPKLGQAFSATDGPIPALWPQFDALNRLPVMVIRGLKSDLLSGATVEAMRQRHPDVTLLEIAGEGHAPWLRDLPSIEAVRRFLERTDPV
ncbi:MAG: alpha/beta hydrolase [Hyphomicrobium sp.]|jgi:pimeloyl-ACP methyl ester carboxylesterase|nr:alpha/beta hydrolase [Hyphomicrobium sp.]